MIKLLQIIDDRIKAHNINIEKHREYLLNNTDPLSKNKCKTEIRVSKGIIKELNYLIENL